MIADYVEKKKEDKKSGIVTAFYSAYFSRLEKLSGADLEEVLKRVDEPEKQVMSAEQMFNVCKGLAGEPLLKLPIFSGKEENQ